MQATALVARAAATWLEDRRFADVPEAERSSLRELFRTADPAAPDYDHLHAAFAAEFLLVNFRKCAAALDEARPTPSPVVVDIGCGSGASAAAALVYLFEAGLAKVDLHLVDRSKEQLTLAQDLLEVVVSRLRRKRPFAVRIFSTNGEWPAEPMSGVGTPALVLASHVLTENRPHAADFLDKAVGLAGPSGSVTVIERGDDPLWGELDAHVAESVLVRRTGRQDVDAKTADGQRRNWATRWLTLERSAYPQCERAVRGYLTAWRKKDADGLAGVFTERAQYWDKPFQSAIDGLAEIQEYWRNEVTRRRSVTVVVQSIAYRSDGAHLEWRATLDDGDDTVKVVYGFMVIEVDPAGKIRELRECYRSQREARDPAVRSRPRDRRDA